MKNWYYGTGKKKRAIAKVFIKVGCKKNIFFINNKTPNQYFSEKLSYKIIFEPIKLLNFKKKLTIIVKIKGGGYMGQIYAIRHGLSKAFYNYNKKYKDLLNKYKLLTRDSRIVERKKLGKVKARKSKQFSKR